MPERKLRSVRVEAYIWDAAVAKAKAEDRSLSEVVRELLAKWVTKPPR